MKDKGNWSALDEKILKDMLAEHRDLKEIAARVGRSVKSVYLYCYRHRIPVRQTLDKPLMVEMLRIKFGNPNYFQPNAEFFKLTGMTTKRWADLSFGYCQPTQQEMLATAQAINLSLPEAFALMEARQLTLFDNE